MKISFLFLFIFTTAIFAEGAHSQIARVNIQKQSGTLREVINEIENQTDYLFVYNKSEVNMNQLVTVSAKNQLVANVLSNIFNNTDIVYAMTGNNIMLMKVEKVLQIQQDGKHITGTVTDESGEPLIGVSIRIKDTATGTITDIDGKFTIQISGENTVLVFSYVGFKNQEIVVGNRNDISVVLVGDSSDLDEIVVVGYGVQKKQSLTGAVTAINSDEIMTTKTENLITNVQGKIPGLLIRQKTGEPGTFDNMVSIRGYGDPLVVIDGVTRDGGTSELAQLNADDIESISVLKDASASIYGMGAANGVILVTTKKGVAEKPRISYSGLFGLKNATGMESTVDAYTYRLIANEMARNGQQPAAYSNDVLEKYRTGAPGYTDNDWLNMFMNNLAFQQNHTISVRGGSEKTKYFASFGYTEDNGLLKSGIQYYKRYNLRSNLTTEIVKGITLNIDISGRMDETQRPREDFLWTYKTLVVNDRGIGWHTMDNPTHLSNIGPEGKNPYALVDPEQDGYRRGKGLTYSADVELSWKVPFADGLIVGILGSFDGNNRNNSTLQKSYPLYDYFTDAPSGKYGSDNYSNTMGIFQKVYGRGQANYLRSFGEHNINLLGVVELSSTRYDELNGARQYTELFTNDILNQASASTASNSGYRNYTRRAAYLMRANYDYAGRYLLEAVGRYDGSYRYAPAKRWAFFPSVSVGWRISEEKFIKENVPLITNLKLRASYGESGTDTGDAFQYISAYTASSLGYVFDGNSQVVGMKAPGMQSDQLSWITSKISNIGLDFDFWNGKLNGTVEFFQRKNDGLLGSRIQTIPNTFGADFPQENINSNMNMGFEVSLGTRGKIGKDFEYQVSANLTYARVKTLHQERGEFSSSMDRWLNGQENRLQGGISMYKYNGQYTSIEQYETAPLMGGSQGNSMMLPGSYKLVDLNGNGIISRWGDMSDLVMEFWGNSTSTGSLNPPLQYGLVLAGSYKNFDVNMLFQGASLFSISYPNDDVWGYLDKTNPTLIAKYMDRWHTVNPTDDPYNPTTKWVSGFYPALRKSSGGTTESGNYWAYGIDVWNPDATYLRLKSLEIGYTLSKSLTQKMGVGSVRLFVNGSNLLTFCNRQLKNADPEREEAAWSASLAYPLMRAYNFGLNINF
ncbi:TonB-dependent receptor [Dysgonomonas termitidis]|uniref:TonB-dependent receptor n=1 Tax=Dysgonomonas termitidis TaxID=1516126 RepID=A0ABV9KYZ1_9BACT